MKKFLKYALVIIMIGVAYSSINTYALANEENLIEVQPNNETEYVDIEVSEFNEDLNNNEKSPNWGTVSATCTDTQIKIKVSNIGIDPLDSVTGTVTINGKNRSFDMGKVWPGSETKTLNVPMSKVSESIHVEIKIRDGGKVAYKTGKTSRAISSTSKWHKGNYGSVNASLEDHYDRHKGQVGATSIVNYLNKAIGFSTNLKGASVSNVNGFTPGVKRYKKLGKYIDLAPDKRIVSFGGQK